MRSITIENEVCSVNINLKDEEITWTKIMLSILDCFNGLGYSASQLEEFRDEWWEKNE